MQQTKEFQDVIMNSEFFSLDVRDAQEKGNSQDIGGLAEALVEFDLPVEFFQYFQVEPAIS